MKQNKKQKTILGIGVIIAFICTAVIVALASQSGGAYITGIVREEQVDHYQRMHENVEDLTRTYQELQEYLNVMEERNLLPEEKKDASKILRHLEEIGLNMSRRAIFYHEDTTAHFFFPPEKKIIEYFDELRNTPLYINRCVRFVETGLTIPYLSRTQKQSMQENCTALSEEIDRVE